MVLQTERLILRPWKESDAEAMYEYAKDERVGTPAGWPAHKDIEESLARVRRFMAEDEVYAICLKDDDRPIGNIQLKLYGNSDLVRNDREGELGYWLGVPFWGKGYMPEAAREVLRHAFEDLEMERVWAGYYEGNHKSKRVQEKCGMKAMWTTEGLDVPQMHEKRTGHVTCITKEEWNG